MSLDKTRLTEFLQVIGKKLSRKITLVAVGGTALTLLDLKQSTEDIDFVIPHGEDFDEFIRVKDATPHGLRIDVWPDGMVFSTMLPDDYLTKCILSDIKLENIKLYSLHPLDVVMTKIGRLNDRDRADITNCMKKYNITKEQIRQRATQIEVAGSEEAYDVNLHVVLNTDFD